MTERRDKIRYLALGMALALLACAAVLLTCGIRYETNDDATLANIAAGAYGDDTLHMIYVNVLFALLLRPLYALAPAVNWYVIVQLALVVAALGCLFAVFLKNSGIKNGLLFSLAVLVPFSVTLFYSFQYVKCCAVLLAVGLVLIADDLGSGKGQTVAGILFVWLGSLIRWENFCAVGALSACMLLYRFFRLDAQHKKRAVITVLVLFCAVLGGKACDAAAYANGEWAEYRQYNKARMELSDFKIYFVDQEADDPLAGAGVSDIEYEMLEGWDFWDADRFPAERIRQIADSIRPPSFAQGAKDTVKAVFDLLHGESWRYVFWLVVAVGLLLLRPGAEWLAFAGTLTVGGGLLFYLQWRARFPTRVEVTLLFGAVAIGAYLITKGQMRLRNRTAVYATVLVVACLLSVHSVKEGIASGAAHRERMHEEDIYFEQMSADAEHLYLLSTTAIQVAAGEDVWHPRPKDFYHNIVAYGGWMTNTPSRRQALAAYGIGDVFTDTVNNPTVYFDYHNIDRTAAYSSVHTGKNVCAVSVGDNAFASYQLVTE